MTRYVRTARPVAAFAGTLTTRRFRVDEDGGVGAWDDVAGHYTTLHSLTPHQIGAIRRLARASAPVGDE